MGAKAARETDERHLREHYRCHPKIINFCNQKFYHGQLIIMTKDHDESDVLTMFLGANIDAAKEAARFGIGADRAVNYKCDEAGTALNYEVISEAVCCVRAASPLSADWKRRIDEDVEKRGR